MLIASKYAILLAIDGSRVAQQRARLVVSEIEAGQGSRAAVRGWAVCRMHAAGGGALRGNRNAGNSGISVPKL
jgi:hypothetical protein